MLNIHNARFPERIWNRLAVIESQLAWQEALLRDTDVATQTPFVNPQGDRVALLPYTNEIAETIKCVLLNWIPGEPKPETPETTQIMGEVAAQIHNHSEHWQRQPEFTRPIQDIHWLRETCRDLTHAKRDGRFSAAEFDLIQKVIDKYTKGNFQETIEPVLHYTEPQVFQRFSNEARSATKTV